MSVVLSPILCDWYILQTADLMHHEHWYVRICVTKLAKNVSKQHAFG